MKKIITSIISTKTFSQSAISFGGTFINGILGFIFYILIARYLGTANFGIFSICITAATLLTSIANIGVDTGLIRFVGKHINNDKEKALKFLKLGLKIKIISFLTIYILGWLLLPFICKTILLKPELISPLRFSLLGIGTALLFSFATSSVQAMQRFWVWSGLNIFANATRLLSLIILFSLGLVSIHTGLAIYIIFPLLGFFLGLLFLPDFWKAKNEKEILPEFFKYNQWILISTILVAISTRLDTFMSTRLLSLSEVGIYSVAVSLAGVVPQIVNALATVVAPKLAGFNKNEQVIRYLIKLQLFVSVLAVLGLLLGIPLARFIIPAFYGHVYISSFSPFVVLLLAQAIFLVSIPVHSAVFYYFAYPKLFVRVSVVNILIIGLVGWPLISLFGLMGAAWTVLFGNVSNFIIPGIWVLNKFKKI